MQRWLWCVICLLSGVVAGAQSFRPPLATAGTGLEAYSRNHSSVFSFTLNQAALAALKGPEMAICGERKYLLSELGHYAAVIGLPAGPGNFGLKTVYAGFGGYRETQLGIAYARSLGKKADAGIQINYSGIRIPSGYGSASALSAELGMLLHITDALHAGIHINNPAGGKFGKLSQVKLPSVYRFGLGYEASEIFFAGAEIVKEEDQPVEVHAGLKYRLSKQLSFKGGVSTATASGWIGAGFSKGKMNLEVLAHLHPQLGVTPGLLFGIGWGKENK